MFFCYVVQGRWTVGSVGSEEGSADCVESEGEDGKDKRDKSPAGAKRGEHHGG